MNVKRMAAYGVYYLIFGVLFFLLEIGLLAHLEKDWQFILATTLIFFGILNPLMNYFKTNIEKFLNRK